MKCPPGHEEAFVLKMEGPFQQLTGGKGANAAAAAGQTWDCEFVGNFGAESKVRTTVGDDGGWTTMGDDG